MTNADEGVNSYFNSVSINGQMWLVATKFWKTTEKPYLGGAGHPLPSPSLPSLGPHLLNTLHLLIGLRDWCWLDQSAALTNTDLDPGSHFYKESTTHPFYKLKGCQEPPLGCSFQPSLWHWVFCLKMKQVALWAQNTWPRWPHPQASSDLVSFKTRFQFFFTTLFNCTCPRHDREKAIWLDDCWLGRRAHKIKAYIFMLRRPDSVL